MAREFEQKQFPLAGPEEAGQNLMTWCYKPVTSNKCQFSVITMVRVRELIHLIRNQNNWNWTSSSSGLKYKQKTKSLDEIMIYESRKGLDINREHGWLNSPFRGTNEGINKMYQLQHLLLTDLQVFFEGFDHNHNSLNFKMKLHIQY